MINGDITNKTYYKYAKDVINGKIKTGHNIILACKRFLKDLERNDIIFEVGKADNVIEFIGLMKHNTA